MRCERRSSGACGPVGPGPVHENNMMGEQPSENHQSFAIVKEYSIEGSGKQPASASNKVCEPSHVHGIVNYVHGRAGTEHGQMSVSKDGGLRPTLIPPRTTRC